MSYGRRMALGGIALSILLLNIVAGTYAFFTYSGATERSQSTTISTINGLVMKLSDAGQTGISGAIDPNNLKFTTYFSIENGGQGEQYAKIMFKNLINTYSEDLVYTLEEINVIPTGEESPTVIRTYKNKASVPSNTSGTPKKAELYGQVLVNPGTTSNNGTITKNTQYYRLTVEYLYSDTKDQSPDATASFFTELDMELGHAPYQFTCVDNSNKETTCDTIKTGTKIALGTERFYVISNNEGTIRALAENNLAIAGSGDEILQDQTNAVNSVIFNAGDVNTLPYTVYTNEASTAEIAAGAGRTSYQESSIKKYVDDYKIVLNQESYANGKVTDVDLISFPELLDLGCSRKERGGDSNTCNTSSYSWVKSANYWSKDSRNENDVWFVLSDGTFEYDIYYRNSYGVRPVITIPATVFSN